MFHVSILKKEIGEKQNVLKDLPTLNNERELESFPQAVLGSRLKKGKTEVLVLWR